MGRPSSYSEEIADKIVDRLMEASIRKVCEEEGMPDRNTVNRWMLIHPEFAAKCARAREIRAAAYVEETIEIADQPAPTNAFGSVDGGAVQDKKVKIAARQWYAEKIDPRRFGQKVAIGGAEDLPPLKNLTDDDLEARIRAKLEAMNASKPE